MRDIGKNGKKKIKTCIFAHFIYPLYLKHDIDEPFGGGAGVQLYLLSKELAKSGILDVSVITGNHPLRKHKIEITQNVKLHNVLPLKRSVFNIPKYLLSLFKTLIKINPDVVILRASGFPIGLCALYCKIFRKKLIYSVSSEPDVDGRHEKGIVGKMFKFGIEKSSMLVAQNNKQIRLYVQSKRKKNICLIRSGYDLMVPKKTEKTSILWVSRALKLKRAELFLKLALQFPDEKFVMISNYDNQDISYWNEIASDASKIPNMVFIKHVPFNKIETFFQEAKVFVNTSTYEGFPNTFIQSFKNKTPVLSLKVDPDNILRDKELGFQCNDDYDTLVNNLALLIKDKQLAEKMGENGYDFVKAYNNIEEIGQKWTELIGNLMIKD